MFTTKKSKLPKIFCTKFQLSIQMEIAVSQKTEIWKGSYEET